MSIHTAARLAGTLLAMFAVAKLLRDFRLPDAADAPAAYERVRIREAKTKAQPKSKRAKRVAT